MNSMCWGWTAFLVVLSWGAMGCSSSSAPVTALDGGGGGKDASQLTDVKDVVVEPLQPFDGQYGGEGGSPGTGTMLQPFYGAVLSGVTSDGWVVYGNGGEVPTYYAAPLDGGAAVDLGLSQSYGYTIVLGEVAFIFSSIDVDDGTYASPISIWTSKNGEKLLTMNSFLENAAVSSDNNYVLYYDNLNPTAQTGDLYLAKTDGTGATLLESALPGLTPGGMCEPSFGFAGTTAYVAWCPSGSTTSVTIATFPAPYTGVPGDSGTGDAGTGALVTDVTSLAFGVDPTFTYLSFVTSAGLNVVPLVGGTPTLIDATGTDGVFTSTGMNILYATTVKNLDSSPVVSPLENVLVTGGVDGVYGLSPNGATALVFSSVSSGLTDLYTASASTAGSLTKLTSSVTSSPAGYGVLSGNPFTADSSEVLFFTSITGSPEGSPYGALYFGNPSTGAATMLSTGASNTVWATTGTKVVYSDSLLFLATTTMDILAVDVASGTPTLISHAATAGDTAAFYLSPAKDKIIYSWTSPGTESGGIFVAPVP
jgi:hypothetical protein